MIKNLANKPSLTNAILLLIVIAPIVHLSPIAEIFDLKTLIEQFKFGFSMPWASNNIDVHNSNNASTITYINQLLTRLSNSYAITATIISTIICAMGGILLTRLTIRSTVFLDHLFTPAIPFMIASFPIIVSSDNLAWAVASILIIKSLSVAIQSYNIKGNATGKLFIASIYSSLSALVFAPTILLSLSLLFGLFAIRRANFKELIAVVIGILTPLLYSFLVEYYFELEGGLFSINALINLISNINPEWVWKNAFSSITRLDYITSSAYYTVMILVLLISMIYISTKKSYEMKPKNLASFRFFSLSALICLIYLALSTNSALDTLAILSIPAATIIPIFLCSKGDKKSINIIYSVFIILGLIYIYC